MACEKFYLYFKTNLKVDEFLTEDRITESKDFSAENDHLYIYSRRNVFASYLTEIFEKLNQDFNLDFLINEEYVPYEKYEETQIVFTLPQQKDVVKSINDLYDALEKQQLILHGDNLSNLIHEAELYRTSDFEFEDGDSVKETIWNIELIKRFVEQSIIEQKIVVKYDYNS